MAETNESASEASLPIAKENGAAVDDAELTG